MTPTEQEVIDISNSIRHFKMREYYYKVQAQSCNAQNQLKLAAKYSDNMKVTRELRERLLVKKETILMRLN